MSNIDEKIAKMRLQQRIEKEKEQTEEKTENTEKKEIKLEDIISQIKEGEVLLEEKIFRFRENSYFKGLLEIPIPLEYLKEQENTEQTVSLLNDVFGISFIGNYLKEIKVKQSFDQIKKAIEKNFKDNKIYLEWLEEGKCGQNGDIPYAIYRIPTGKGQTFNFMFYREKKGTVIMGNYNCFEKDYKVWGLLIKASFMLIKVK